MKRYKRFAAALLVAALLLSLTGCLSDSAEELYSLPEMSEDYLQLQSLLDVEVEAGCEYSAPLSGSHRQSVQLYDLDGDGVNEALAFFLDGRGQMKICVYRTQESEDYALALTIAGEGTSIGTIEYSDVDGDGLTELLVSWQVSAEVRMLKVYSLREWSGTEILTASCAEFIVSDLDSDGLSEVLALTFDYEGGSAADMYAFDIDDEYTSSRAKLSAHLSSTERVRTGLLSDGASALFVESLDANGMLVTDIFTVYGGKLVNIALDETTGVSVFTREYIVYCTDIDSDRCMEIPVATRLAPQSETASTYYMLEWYTLDSRGLRTARTLTYHCYTDGWYLVLDGISQQGLTVRRDSGASGERTVVFSRFSAAGTVEDLLYIYTLTGENRYERADLPGRFTLSSDDTTIYAARIAGASLTQEETIARFHLIYSEWITGDL